MLLHFTPLLYSYILIFIYTPMLQEKLELLRDSKELLDIAEIEPSDLLHWTTEDIEQLLKELESDFNYHFNY